MNRTPLLDRTPFRGISNPAAREGPLVTMPTRRALAQWSLVVGAISAAPAAWAAAAADTAHIPPSQLQQGDRIRSDDGQVTMPEPLEIAINRDGTLVGGNPRRQIIQAFSKDGKVRVVAGADGQKGYRDGMADQARFHTPGAVAVDPVDGAIYVSDQGNRVIRRVGPDGMVSTFAGRVGEAGDRDGPRGQGTVNMVDVLIVAPDRSIYLSDDGMVRRLTPDGTITTLAGSSEPGRHPDRWLDPTDGPARSVQFGGIEGMALSASGDLFIADAEALTIRKLSRDGRVATVAGFYYARGHDDGVGSDARFAKLRGMAIDDANDLYVVDAGNRAIRRVDAAGHVVTIAGRFNEPLTRNGPAAQARFVVPESAAWADGMLYVSDSVCKCIRVISKSGEVSTFANY